MTNEQKTIKDQLEELIANFCQSMAIAMPDCNVSISISNVDVEDAEPLIETTDAKVEYRCNSTTGAINRIYRGMTTLDTNNKYYLHLTTKNEEHEKCI